MKIIHLNYSDINGGAARAAHRIHHCLLDAGVDSRLWVCKSESGDWTVNGPCGKFDKAMIMLRPYIASYFTKTLTTSNSTTHSPSVLPSNFVARINSSDADVVHLHWVHGEMLSVKDIGRIKKPIVWTLHDMWGFCGAEHYSDELRWRDGYHRNNRPINESGFDLNRWTWGRKRKYWKRSMHIVTPSQWLAVCAQNSALMKDWPVSVVPNAIDTKSWSPIKKNIARDILGLPSDVPLLLFGAIGGGSDPRKGFDLLLDALKFLSEESNIRGLELMVFGQMAPKIPINLGFPIHYTGHLHDDISLRLLYSAADALVIPSRIDNLPNTGLEAQACACPVIGFKVGGLPDIITHKHNGYLAEAFDIKDLAQGVSWVINNRVTCVLQKQSRERAEDCYSFSTISKKYLSIYNNVLNA
jgi:glycosyltransferase involved in cell wall biosynthesis